MKKILIVGKDIVGFGGLETVVSNFMLNLNKKGIHCKLVILGSHGNDAWCQGLDFEIISTTKKLKKINRTYIFTKMILREKPDYIICLHHPLLPQLSLAKKISYCKSKLNYWPHNTIISITGDKSKRKEKFLFCIRHANEFFAISSGIKKEFKELGIEDNYIHLIYNPLTRQETFIPKSQNSNQFIYIGRLTFEGQKRIKDIVDAFSLLNENEEFELKIIGNGDDRQIIVDYIKLKRLEHKITLTQDWVMDPWDIIKEADALILSSEHEGLGMVLGEAMSRGLPCISSDCFTGPRDFINDGVNGYLYEPKNIEELKEKILNIIHRKLPYKAENLKTDLNKMYEDTYYSKVLEILSNKG